MNSWEAHHIHTIAESVSEFPAHPMNLEIDGNSDTASVSVTGLRFYIFRKARLCKGFSLVITIFVLPTYIY